MAIFYPMPECEAGNHGDCAVLRQPSTPDAFDAWMCSCPCHSDYWKEEREQDQVQHDEAEAA